MALGFCISVPGSVILFGEHAILYGHSALIAAVPKELRIEATLRRDSNVIINTFGRSYRSLLLDVLTGHVYFPEIKLILDILKKWHYKIGCINSGFELSITSNLPSETGLGSSGAILTGITAALCNMFISNFEMEPDVIYKHAVVINKILMPYSSGYDIVGSCFGGLSYFDGKNVFAMEAKPKFYLHNVGYKVKTIEVLRQVEKKWSENKKARNELYNKMGAITEEVYSALQQHSYTHLGYCAVRYQSLLSELGVSDDFINNLITNLNQRDGILGCKISGAGLGDSIIAFIEPNSLIKDYLLPNKKGVSLERY